MATLRIEKSADRLEIERAEFRYWIARARRSQTGEFKAFCLDWAAECRRRIADMLRDRA